MRNIIKYYLNELVENFDESTDWVIVYDGKKTLKKFQKSHTKKQVMDWASDFYGREPEDMWANTINESPQPEVKPEVKPDVKPTTEPSPFTPPPFINPGEEPRPKLVRNENKNRR